MRHNGLSRELRSSDWSTTASPVQSGARARYEYFEAADWCKIIYIMPRHKATPEGENWTTSSTSAISDIFIGDCFTINQSESDFEFFCQPIKLCFVPLIPARLFVLRQHLQKTHRVDKKKAFIKSPKSPASTSSIQQGSD